MNYNELVKKMDDIRSIIQRGEAVEYEGGVQQLIYEGECAITALLKEWDSAVASRKKYEELFHEVKTSCNELREKNEKLDEMNERMGRIIDHLLDE